ncbi:hypothetical protein IIA15_10175 [candidate division TA06 bacterium]|nr:hypothetical protein [candidate division TA06 bacterium]
MDEDVGSHTEKEIAERIRNAAYVYNKEVERAKILNIKVLTTPCGDGKLKIRMIQVLCKLWEAPEET